MDAAEIGVDTAGDAYLPQSGNGGYARSRSRPRCGTASPATDSTAPPNCCSRAHQRLARFSLDLVGLSRRRACASTGDAARLPAGAAASSASPRSARRDGRRGPRRRRVRRRPEAPAHAVVGDDRLGGARRRGARGVAAVGRADVVPVQRPSVRQGDATASASTTDAALHRRRQRRARGPPGHQRAGRVGLRPARADGDLPRRRCRSGRYAKRSLAFDGAGCDVYFPRALERRGARRLRAAAADARGASRTPSGPYPFGRYARRRHARRARDPARGAGARGLRREPRRWRRRRAAAHRPRARPPVVRQQRGRRALAGHLAQRGLLLLRRVAVVGGLGQATADQLAEHHHARLAQLPAGSPHRRPRPGEHVRRPRLQARRADPARAPTGARRRRVLRRAPRMDGDDRRHGSATTADFIALVAARTHRDFAAFFEAWLYHPALPRVPAAGPVTGGAGGSRRRR